MMMRKLKSNFSWMKVNFELFYHTFRYRIIGRVLHTMSNAISRRIDIWDSRPRPRQPLTYCVKFLISKLRRCLGAIHLPMSLKSELFNSRNWSWWAFSETLFFSRLSTVNTNHFLSSALFALIASRIIFFWGDWKILIAFHPTNELDNDFRRRSTRDRIN